MEDWIGTGAVIIGANSGAGVAVTKRLIEMGLNVVGLDAETEMLKALKHGKSFDKDSFHYLKVNICNDEDILEAFQLVEEFVGGANFMVNITGILENPALLDSEAVDLKSNAKRILLAPTLCSREFVRSASDRHIPLGHIINIMSLHADKVPKKSSLHFYSSLKAGINRMFFHLRQELEFLGSSIKVTNICSAPIMKTPTNQNCTKVGPDIIDPENIADAIEFLIKTPYHVQVRDIWIQGTIKTDERPNIMC